MAMVAEREEVQRITGELEAVAIEAGDQTDRLRVEWGYPRRRLGLDKK